MLCYCLKCKNNTKSFNPKVTETKNDGTIILSHCDVCASKKSRFMKKQEAKGKLSSLSFNLKYH